MTEAIYKQTLEELYEGLGKVPASNPGTLSALSNLREKIFLALNPKEWFTAPCGHTLALPSTVVGKSECKECPCIYLVERTKHSLEVQKIA